MAEINIQRKRKPVWPWVILAIVIVLAALVWYWNYSGGDLDVPAKPTSYRPSVGIDESAAAHFWLAQTKMVPNRKVSEPIIY